MKRWIPLAAILILGLAAIAFSERRKVDSPASPAALLYLVADTEHELTRMPVRFTRLSDDDEIRAGDDLAKGYFPDDQDKPTEDFTQIQSYLNQIGSRVAQHAHRKLPYRFHYIPDMGFVNAFALPGGHVYLGAGLLALMDSEDELAAVLGHEIEHIDHYHCAERLQTEQALRKVPLAELVALPVAIFQAGYSKDQELEADREGTELSVEAGYSASGAIRIFETFQRLYDQIHAKAKTPQDELSQVAIDALEGYFRSHPLPSERIAQINKMIAASSWPTHPERDLAIAYIFWTDRANQALDQGKYPQAQELATRAAQMHSSGKILRVLAQAQFLQADFAGAAATYRKILDADVWTIDFASAYARSLAVAHLLDPANEFRRWIALLPGDTQPLQVPLDGLLLLAGDPSPAHRLQTEILANLGNNSAPEQLSDLSWWFYMAKDYSNAADLQHEAIQRRPGSLLMLMRLTWIEIDQHRLADAFETIQRADRIVTTPATLSERMMATAIARWQSQDRDTALIDFERAIIDHPEWANPHWVSSLFSPLVVQTVQDMQAERDRRKKAKANIQR
jgi:beta-barrel assembly-enhancing protease